MNTINRILIVEDTACQLIVLKAMIESVYPEAVIDTADNYENAIELIDHNLYNLFLLDIELTENRSKNGYAIATYLRQRPENKLTPIVFITAMSSAGNETVPQFKNCYYLIKPYNIPNLVDSIKNASNPVIENTIQVPVDKTSHSRNSYRSEELYYIKFGVFRNYVHSTRGITRTYPHPHSRILSLMPETFVMCGTTYLINLENIDSYDKKTHKARIYNKIIRIPKKYRKMIEEIKTGA